MIKNHQLLEDFELLQLQRPLSLEQRLQIFAAMDQHARDCGVFPRRNPLEDIDYVIERTRKIHSIRRASGES